MASQYYLTLATSAAPAVVIRVYDFDTLVSRIAVNQVGSLIFTIRGDHPALSYCAEFSHVELWREDDGLGVTNYRHFCGVVVGLDKSIPEDAAEMVRVACADWKELLAWRIIAYPAATVNQTQFAATAAETVIKRLVEYNIAASATVANGRLREGAFTGFSVQADGGTGDSIVFYCFADNLLDACLRIGGEYGGGDFDVVKVTATTWEFRWYAGQLGTDRRTSVYFALDLGNMGNPKLIQDWKRERTAAIVGGQGEEASRSFEIVTGANYNVNTNNREIFYNAVDVPSSAGLTQRGSENLREIEARRKLLFDVAQTPASAYGAQYFLGDLVTAINPFDDTSMTQQISAVRITLTGYGTGDVAETIIIDLVEREP